MGNAQLRQSIWGARNKLCGLLALILVGLALARLIGVIAAQLVVPFDLVFETPTLSVVQFLKMGGDPYSPEVYAQLPFVTTVYTPLYSLLASLLPMSDANPFLWARLLSMCAMLGAGAALLSAGGGGGRRLLPWLAFACFFSLWPVVSNTAFAKNDPLALCFSAWAVVMVAHSRGSAVRVVSAALLCSLAIATKQSYVAAPAACLLHLAVADGRGARVFAFSLSVVLLAMAGVASWVWGQGFWFSVLVSPSNPVLASNAWAVSSEMLRQPLFVFLLCVSLWLAARALAGDRLRSFERSPYLLYLVFSAAVAAATVGKAGASTNYFFEFALAQLLWAVFWLRERSLSSLLVGKLGLAVFGGLLLCLALQLGIAERRDYSFVSSQRVERRSARSREILRHVASLGLESPRLLNPFTSLDTFSVLGPREPVYLNDPFHYRLLWEAGKLSYAPLVQSIEDRFFDVVLLPARLDADHLPKGPLGAISGAVLRHYVLGVRGSRYGYYVRPLGAPAL
jgi:hypothetical protein